MVDIEKLLEDWSNLPLGMTNFYALRKILSNNETWGQRGSPIDRVVNLLDEHGIISVYRGSRKSGEITYKIEIIDEDALDTLKAALEIIWNNNY